MKTASNEKTYSTSEKWGLAATSGETGYQSVPDILFRYQAKLNITNTELIVLLNVMLHWWEVENWPHPRPSAIANRMGVNIRTVERAIITLEEKKLLRRLKSEQNSDGLRIRKFDLSSLVAKLEEIAAAIHLSNQERAHEKDN